MKRKPHKNFYYMIFMGWGALCIIIYRTITIGMIYRLEMNKMIIKLINYIQIMNDCLINSKVLRARNLLDKGKGGNDAYCMIGMGKEKFLTSVRNKNLSPIWDEQAEL